MCGKMSPSLGIQSYCQILIGVSNHLLSIVSRFHYHSQKVIGSLGLVFWGPFSIFNGKLAVAFRGWAAMRNPKRLVLYPSGKRSHSWLQYAAISPCLIGNTVHLQRVHFPASYAIFITGVCLFFSLRHVVYWWWHWHNGVMIPIVEH